jgi:hypothetical protein
MFMPIVPSLGYRGPIVTQYAGYAGGYALSPTITGMQLGDNPQLVIGLAKRVYDGGGVNFTNVVINGEPMTLLAQGGLTAFFGGRNPNPGGTGTVAITANSAQAETECVIWSVKGIRDFTPTIYSSGSPNTSFSVPVEDGAAVYAIATGGNASLDFGYSGLTRDIYTTWVGSGNRNWSAGHQDFPTGGTKSMQITRSSSNSGNCDTFLIALR